MFILKEIEKLSFLKIVYSLMMEDNILTDQERNILEDVLCKEVFQLDNDISDYETKFSSITKLKGLLENIQSNEVKVYLFKILDDIVILNPKKKNEINEKINKLKELM